MRRILLVLVMGGLLASCASTPTTISSSPITSPGDTAGQSGTTPPAGAAGVGDAITLHGQDSALVVDVTLVKLVDPVKPSDLGLPAGSGKRLLAIQVRLHNTGTVVYDDSPGNGAKVIDSDDQSFSSTINFVTGCEVFADGSARIAAGSSALGCIVFEVPKGVTLTTLQFALDSGFGPDTGEWAL